MTTFRSSMGVNQRDPRGGEADVSSPFWVSRREKMSTGVCRAIYTLGDNLTEDTEYKVLFNIPCGFCGKLIAITVDKGKLTEITKECECVSAFVLCPSGDAIHQAYNKEQMKLARCVCGRKVLP